MDHPPVPADLARAGGSGRKPQLKWLLVVFNSLSFLLFFIAVWTAYRFLSHANQNRMLLVASYAFYGAWDYRFLALLGFSTVVDYYIALAMHAQREEAARKRLLLVSIAVNLGILGFFKYFNFFTDSFADLAAVFGWSVSATTLSIILPVGISFYTFQAMSYSIDVYRRKIEPCRSLADFALFVAFFPQLVAGPIERAKQLLPQIALPRAITAGKIGSGLYLVLLGLFKKAVVADNLAPTVDQIFGAPAVTGEEVVVGALYFAIQIYCDFSGYSDMARGTARILGFDLMVNFRQPFFAKDVFEFLRRWHISLSTWLRDYLFQSLGGVKRNSLLTLRNLAITMFLCGLWHGAAWNFVLWGLYLGAMMTLRRAYDTYAAPLVDRLVPQTRATAWARGGLERAVMICGTLYGFMIFRSMSGSQIVDMTMALGNFESFSFVVDRLVKLLVIASPVLLLDVWEYRTERDEAFIRAPAVLQTVSYAAALMLFLTIGQYDVDAFIYFQF